MKIISSCLFLLYLLVPQKCYSGDPGGLYDTTKIEELKAKFFVLNTTLFQIDLNFYRANYPTSVVKDYVEGAFEEQNKVFTYNSNAKDISVPLKDSSFVLHWDYHQDLEVIKSVERVLGHMQGSRGDPVFAVVEQLTKAGVIELKKYFRNEIDLNELKKRVWDNTIWEKFPWEKFARYFKFLKTHEIDVLPGYPDNTHWTEAFKRDQFVLQTIREHRSQNPAARYFLFYGEFHILGPQHLRDLLLKQFRGKKTISLLGGYPIASFWNFLSIQSVEPPDRILGIPLHPIKDVYLTGNSEGHINIFDMIEPFSKFFNSPDTLKETFGKIESLYKKVADGFKNQNFSNLSEQVAELEQLIARLKTQIKTQSLRDESMRDTLTRGL